MGKMIDAQSIMVACAACYDDPEGTKVCAGADLPHGVLALDRRRSGHRRDRASAGVCLPGMIPIPPVGK